MMQGNLPMLTELRSLAEDTVDAKIQNAEILTKSITEAYKLVVQNTLDPNAPKTPQQRKNVDQRRGPDQGE